MANTVKLIQSVDDRDVVQAFQRQLQLLDRMERRLDQVGKKGQKGGQQIGGAFRRAASEALRMASAMAGIGTITSGINTAIGALRREIDNIKSRQQDAAGAQIEAARQEQAFMQNFGAGAARRGRERIEQIARDTGAKQADLFAAASAAMSSKGLDLTEDQAFDAVRVAASINRFDREAMATNAVAILNQQKAAGGTAENIAGFQAAIKQASPVVSDTDFAQNIAPAIAGLHLAGNDLREAGAVLATLGQGASDPTGRKTRTAAIRFDDQLRQLIPSVDGQEVGLIRRLEMVQNNPALRQRLLGSLDEEIAKAMESGEVGEKGELVGEAAFLATMRQLLQEGPNQMKSLLRRNLQEIPDIAQGGKVLDTILGEMASSPLQQTARLSDEFASIVEGLQLRDVSGARAAVSRKGMQEVLKAAKVSAIDQFMEGLGFEAGGGLDEEQPLRHVAQRARSRSEELLRTKAVSAGPGAPGVRVGPTEEESRQGAQFAVVASRLDRLIEVMDRNNAATEENNRMMRNQGKPPTKDLSRR